MKLKLLAKYLIIPLLLTGVVSINSIQPSQAQQSRGKAYFFCDRHDGKPATIAKHPKRGNITLIIWSLLSFGDDYPPEVRCRLVSERFQKTNTNGSLNYIVSGTLNNYPVLCASRTQPTNQVIDCPNERLLMTLQREDDSQAMIRQIAELNTGRSTSPVEHSADILQESPNGSLVGIDVGVMLRYSGETDETSSEIPPETPNPNPIPPDECDNLFGPCE